MIPSASVIPTAMFSATPVLTLGPGALLLLLVVAALVVLLVRGTMVERRAMTGAETPAGARRRDAILERAA